MLWSCQFKFYNPKVWNYTFPRISESVCRRISSCMQKRSVFTRKKMFAWHTRSARLWCTEEQRSWQLFWKLKSSINFETESLSVFVLCLSACHFTQCSREFRDMFQLKAKSKKEVLNDDVANDTQYLNDHWIKISCAWIPKIKDISLRASPLQDTKLQS